MRESGSCTCNYYRVPALRRPFGTVLSSESGARIAQAVKGSPRFSSRVKTPRVSPGNEKTHASVGSIVSAPEGGLSARRETSERIFPELMLDRLVNESCRR